jgi:hypothetical protein
MKKLDDYQDPKDLKNRETLTMLAEAWGRKAEHDYLFNLRNLYIKSLKKIKTGTIEGDALELAEKRGRISAIEDMLLAQRDAFELITKIKANEKANKKG